MNAQQTMAAVAITIVSIHLAASSVTAPTAVLSTTAAVAGLCALTLALETTPARLLTSTNALRTMVAVARTCASMPLARPTAPLSSLTFALEMSATAMNA